MALYLDYRPQTMGEVVGQSMAKQVVLNSAKNNRIGHAYLFSGPRGTGKTSTARILAKILNCENPQKDGDACGVCNECKTIQAGTSFNVIELDAASNNGVKEIKELVQNAGLGSPGNKKVYILDEAHMLTKQASNALLKTLEESPSHVVFILATTEPEKMLDTIISRTQQVFFSLVDVPTLKAHLAEIVETEELEVDEQTLETVVKQAQGSVRDALTALESAAMGGVSQVDFMPFMQALCAQEVEQALLEAEKLIQSTSVTSIMQTTCEIAREAFLAKMGVKDSETLQEFKASDFTRIIETFGEQMINVKGSPDPRVTLDVTVIKTARFDI